MNNRKGFTLIELLVVVLIIGILASVALPQYFKVVEKGRASEALATISALVSAQSREELRNGDWTQNINDLDIAIPTMKFFNATTTNSVVTLTRKTVPTSPYGAYTFNYYRTNQRIAVNNAFAKSLEPAQ